MHRMPPPAPSFPVPRVHHESIWRILAITQLVCLLIAALLTLMGGWAWWRVNLVYSLIIGNTTSLLINGGHAVLRRLLTRNATALQPERAAGWIGWRWFAPLLLISSVLGYELGATLASRLTGTAHVTLLNGSWRQWGVSALLSLLAASAVSWLFYSRAKISAAERHAAEVARVAAETQLKLLESQLEPHMLFNTLANLRALISVDPERAQQMLDRLIDFLRATLGASRVPLHPLSAEFSRLSDYLALMQVRMGARLQTTLTLPEPLAELPVPPLLLQPLVENAIKHGLEPQRRGGHIHIHARLDSDALVLCVDDTGRGRLAAGSAASGSGFGTTQVRERLATMYGAAASLQLADAPPRTADPAQAAGPGTRAEIRLPLDRVKSAVHAAHPEAAPPSIHN